MKENQTDQQVTDNQSGQQKQDSQSNQQKSGNPSQKSSTTVDAGEEKTDAPPERKGKEHPHEYETPVGEQNRKDENQGGNQNKNQSSNQGAE